MASKRTIKLRQADTFGRDFIKVLSAVVQSNFGAGINIAHWGIFIHEHMLELPNRDVTNLSNFGAALNTLNVPLIPGAASLEDYNIPLALETLSTSSIGATGTGIVNFADFLTELITPKTHFVGTINEQGDLQNP